MKEYQALPLSLSQYWYLGASTASQTDIYHRCFLALKTPWSGAHVGKARGSPRCLTWIGTWVY